MLRAYKSDIVSKQQHFIPLCVGGGGAFLYPATNFFKNSHNAYVFVFITTVYSKICNIALYSDNKRYVLLKKNPFSSAQRLSNILYRHFPAATGKNSETSVHFP
jgi:hypothetical protein